MYAIAVEGAELSFNPAGGLLDRLVLTCDGRRIEPLHRAPWLAAPDEVPLDAAPSLKALAGDFFCAPFGAADVEPAPFHGWSANGVWSLRRTIDDPSGAITAIFDLEERIAGARLRKEITLRPNHPVVYQRHVFTGGQGALPIAHHAMIHVPGGARLSFSPKDFGATPAAAVETDPARGRSLLTYPQCFAGLRAVALAGGGIVDARTYPFADRHEDFLTLFDRADARMGWTAALAQADGFLFFAVKDARILCQTSLWMSNGGRYYAPWLSRHRAVLGLEESCAMFGNGHRASIEGNAVARAGYRTALPLDPNGEREIRYALGAIPADPAWSEVADIVPGDGRLTIRDVGGRECVVPFDSALFGLG